MVTAATLAMLWPSHFARSAVLDVPTVEIVAPVPIGKTPKAKAPGECTTGCSLAKHPIPDFTPDDYLAAVARYAKADADAAGAALEKLLFYGTRTEELMQRFGTSGLPAAHVSFLRRELSRRHAHVSIRLVDAGGRVRASHGPSRVPLGHKQHLHAVTLGNQSLEFNGTVMRVGLYHLWSRY